MVFDRKKKGETRPHTGQSRGHGRDARATRGDPPSLKLRRDTSAGALLTKGRACFARTLRRPGKMGDTSAFAKATARLAAVRSSGPTYVSAKRTRFISLGKHGLTFRATRCCRLQIWSKYSDSFRKTNPILRGFWRFECRRTTLWRKTNPNPGKAGMTTVGGVIARGKDLFFEP